MAGSLLATTREEADHVEEQRDEGGEEDEGRGDVLVGLHGVLDLVGLIEDHRGHQDDHRDGKPGAQAESGDGGDDDDGESRETADDDRNLQEGEVQIGHEHQGREGRDDRAGDDTSRDEHAAGVALGGEDDVTDERHEDQGLEDDEESEAGVLGAA